MNLLSSDFKSMGCNLRSSELIEFRNKKPKCFIMYQGLINSKGGYLRKITNKRLLSISALLKIIMKCFRNRKKECLNQSDYKSPISASKELQNVNKINESAMIKSEKGIFY